MKLCDYFNEALKNLAGAVHPKNVETHLIMTRCMDMLNGKKHHGTLILKDCFHEYSLLEVISIMQKEYGLTMTFHTGMVTIVHPESKTGRRINFKEPSSLVYVEYVVDILRDLLLNNGKI